MEQAIRSRFGETECELGVAGGSESGFVAWALHVQPDGQLMPLQDRKGVLLTHRADTAARALAELRQRVAAAFGAEEAELGVGVHDSGPN
jgi:hypothetical protein